LTGDGGTGATIEISPSNAELVVRNGVAAAQPYTATARFPDGTTMDVTATALWSSESPLMANFSGSSTLVASGTLAGHTSVRASWNGAAGTAPVTVRVEQQIVDPSVPMGVDAPGLFGAATENPAQAPALVYPSDGTLVPPNLGEFEVHWNAAAGTDLFEITLRTDVLDIRLYTAANFGIYAPAAWKVVGETERGKAVKVAVRGLAATAPATAGTSTPIVVGIGPEDVKGGIYYWAASNSGIYRHDFGKPGQPAEQFYTPTESGGRCVACHALSRDGKRMAVTFDGGDGAATVIDVATRTPLFAADGSVLYSNFSAFSPDGSRFLATSKGVITVRDTMTGAVLATVPTGVPATHPDWSATNTSIVFVEKGSGGDWAFNGGGRLWTISVDPATLAFGTPMLLVDAPGPGLKAYYPTFSPDGAWVLYNVSSEDAYDDPSASIWVVKADGSVPPKQVLSADLAPGLTNSWARWAPFQQATLGEMSEPLYWFTVSSKRAFGVRKPQNNVPQIWMAPFYPNRASMGADPSTPMFRLPFQDLLSSNHIAQWTEEVVPID
jgi:hypothetical protein